jgi:hypothetical protein
MCCTQFWFYICCWAKNYTNEISHVIVFQEIHLYFNQKCLNPLLLETTASLLKQMNQEYCFCKSLGVIWSPYKTVQYNCSCILSFHMKSEIYQICKMQQTGSGSVVCWCCCYVLIFITFDGLFVIQIQILHCSSQGLLNCWSIDVSYCWTWRFSLKWVMWIRWSECWSTVDYDTSISRNSRLHATYWPFET